MESIFFKRSFKNIKLNNHIIFICDHASNKIPQKFKNLGLSKKNIESHIAYDIGAKIITIKLAEKLGQSYFLSNFSRLLIDLNRNKKDEDLIVSSSFGVEVPRNKKISIIERTNRIKFFYTPYHCNLTKFIKKKKKEFKKVILISIHSFSKNTINNKRAIQVGLLWNKNMNLLLPIQKKLIEKNIHLGRNYPYSGFHYNYTLDRQNSLIPSDNISIEIRNDLICSKKGIRKYVETFTNIFKEVLND